MGPRRLICSMNVRRTAGRRGHREEGVNADDAASPGRRGGRGINVVTRAAVASAEVSSRIRTNESSMSSESINETKLGRLRMCSRLLMAVRGQPKLEFLMAPNGQLLEAESPVGLPITLIRLSSRNR